MASIKCPSCGEYTTFKSIRKASKLTCRKCGVNLLDDFNVKKRHPF